jgi:hypothetical protein
MCSIEQQTRTIAAILPAMPDRADLRRLRLRVERAVLAQRQLRALVIEADAALATVRRDLRDAKARIARSVSAAHRSSLKERH